MTSNHRTAPPSLLTIPLVLAQVRAAKAAEAALAAGASRAAAEAAKQQWAERFLQRGDDVTRLEGSRNDHVSPAGYARCPPPLQTTGKPTNGGRQGIPPQAAHAVERVPFTHRVAPARPKSAGPASGAQTRKVRFSCAVPDIRPVQQPATARPPAWASAPRLPFKEMTQAISLVAGQQPPVSGLLRS